MGKGTKQLLGGKYNMVVKGGRASWVTSSSSGASAPGPLGASWNRIFFILRYCRLSSSRTASLVLWIRSIMTVGGRSRSTKRCWGKRTLRLAGKHPYDPQYLMGASIPSSLRQSSGTHVLMGGCWPCPILSPTLIFTTQFPQSLIPSPIADRQDQSHLDSSPGPLSKCCMSVDMSWGLAYYLGLVRYSTITEQLPNWIYVSSQLGLLRPPWISEGNRGPSTFAKSKNTYGKSYIYPWQGHTGFWLDLHQISVVTLVIECWPEVLARNYIHLWLIKDGKTNYYLIKAVW